MIEVGRKFAFVGHRQRTRVSGGPHENPLPHTHSYTVEVAIRSASPVMTDLVDLVEDAWLAVLPGADVNPDEPQRESIDLDAACGVQNIQLEDLALHWLNALCRTVPYITSVTVREEDQAWGTAFAEVEKGDREVS